MEKDFDRWNSIKKQTHTNNQYIPYYIPIGLIGNRSASVIISQIKIIDTRRIDQKITTLDKKLFETIRKAIKDML